MELNKELLMADFESLLHIADFTDNDVITSPFRKEFISYALALIKSLVKENELMHANRTEYFTRAQVNAVNAFADRVKQAICDNTYPDFDKDGKPVNIWKATTGYDSIDEIAKEMIEGMI